MIMNQEYLWDYFVYKAEANTFPRIAIYLTFLK